MDREFTAKLNSLGIWAKQNDTSELSEFSVSFHEHEDGLVKISSAKGEFVYKLKLLQDLYASGGANVVVLQWNDSRIMQLLHAIEGAIKRMYEASPGLTDSSVMLALDKLSMNPELVSIDPVVKAVNNSLRLLLSTENYSRDEVKKVVRKIMASVKRHKAAAGIRGYLDFILEHVP